MNRLRFASVLCLAVAGVCSSFAQGNIEPIFADSFDGERPLGEAWDGVNVNATSTARITRLWARAGAGGLQCYDGGADGAGVRLSKFLEATGELYLRWYFLLPEGYTASAMDSRYMFRAYSGSRIFFAYLTLTEGGIRPAIRADAALSWRASIHQGEPIQEGRWYAMELRLSPPGAATEVEWWIDGDNQDCPPLTGLDYAGGIGRWNQVEFGSTGDVPAEQIQTLYVDEFVIAESRIGPLAGLTDHSLEVESNLPSEDGVEVEVSPLDREGLAGGALPLSRSYAEGQTVELVAPPVVGGLPFTFWRLDDSTFVTQRRIQFSMGMAHALAAVYGAPAEPIFEDSFDGEGQLGDGWDNVTANSGSTAEITRLWARAGAGGLQCFDGGPDDGGVRLSKDIQSTGELYLRWHFLLPEGYIASAVDSRYMLRVSTGSRIVYAYLKLTPAGIQPAIRADAGENWRAMIRQSPESLQEGRWYAMEMRLSPPGASTDVEWWIDGENLGCLPLTGLDYSNGAGVWTQVEFGSVGDVPTTQSQTLCLDELVVASTRIGPHPSVWEHALTVESSLAEAAGVQVEVNPPDLAELGGGSLPLARVYGEGQRVEVVAPAVAEGRAFTHWRLDGSVAEMQRTIQLTMGMPHNLVAVYGGPSPQAHSRSVVTPEDTKVLIPLAGHDRQSNPLSCRITEAPSHGSLVLDDEALMIRVSVIPPGVTPMLAVPQVASGLLELSFDGIGDLSFELQGSTDLKTWYWLADVGSSDGGDGIRLAADETMPLQFYRLLALGREDYQPADAGSSISQLTIPAGSEVTLEVGIEDSDYEYAWFRGDIPLVETEPRLVVQDVAGNELYRLKILTSDVELTEIWFTLETLEADGYTLTTTLMGDPAPGTIRGTGTTATYTPDPDYHGPDRFEFVVDNGSSESAPAVVSIAVDPVNDPPTAEPQTLTTPENTALNLELAGTDVDGDSLTYRIVEQPGHGVIQGTPPDLSYLPASGYSGTDFFRFVANDGAVDSAPSAIEITITEVNGPPTATAQALSTDEDTSLLIQLSGMDPDGDSLSYRVTDPPAHGVLSGTAPNLVYTPSENYSGVDAFAFIVHDGRVDSAPATVSITVRPVADPPVVLVGAGSVWKYLDDGSNQRTAWRGTSFNDSSWESGPAELGYGDGDEATEVSYGRRRSDKHITTYFRRSFTVENAEAFEAILLRLKRDDGAVVYLNGEEVHRVNMPSGQIDHETLAVDAIDIDWDPEVTLPQTLREGANVLAVEIHQGSRDSSDISFDLELVGM
jgi:hypothetical protein